MKVSKKRGRKPAPYVTSQGEVIPGLRHRKHDGRWILSDGRTFTEPDEQKAIEKFRELTGDHEAQWLQRHEGRESHRESPISPARLWAYVAKEIRERPVWVAQQTEIEQIAYLDQVKPPKRLPTFAELEDIWQSHFNKSAEQKRKVIAVWNDFTSTAKVLGLRDITPESVIAFRDAVYARGISGKSQQNLFTRIRRFLSFARDRAVAVEELSRALTVLALLKPSETTITLDPKPIEVEDFRAMLAFAKGDDRALVLVMLNFAMYLKEAVDLRWNDLKGDCLVKHRAKTGRCVRVAVIWKETLEALANVKRRGDFIFYSYQGKPLGVKGAERRFRKLRDAAEVQVTSSQFRDGAATAAIEGNVNKQLCDLLLGHRSGINDHYVKRKPSMVAPACEAIHQQYLGLKSESSPDRHAPDATAA